MEKKVKQLFEYLLALRHLTSQPIRELKKYEKSWMIEELPVGNGCFLGGEGIDANAYLEVHQQIFKQDYPVFDRQLGRIFELLQFDYTKDGSVVCSVDELDEIMSHQYEQLQQRLNVENLEGHQVRLTQWEKFLTQSSDILVDSSVMKERIKEVPLYINECLNWYGEWIEEWKKWALNQKNKRQIQKLYDYFFQLRQMMKSEEESLEVMMGIGVLSYQLKNPIHHPMLVMKLELDFDAERGVAKLLPGVKGYQLDLEVLAGVEFANQQEIMQLKESVSGTMISPFNVSESEGILRQLVHYMHPNGLYLSQGDGEPMSRFPMIKQQSIIFVRKRSEALLKEDLQSTIEYLEDGGAIPKTIQAIIDVDGLQQTQAELKDWVGIGEQLLFPLPANEEQKDIARRLANNIAVTVQGPPGTGKSHTIVNLMAHLLAHGKRVLVTSEKDKALRVLMNKLPEEIQSLCVSFLGGDRQSLAQIEQSIKTISDGLATYDTRLLDKEIQVLSRQLDMVRRQMTITKNNIVRFKELDSKGQVWKDKICQPYEMAQLLAEQVDRFGWIKDKASMDAEPSLTEDQFVTLWELKGMLPAVHKDLAHLKLPALDRLMSMEEYRKLLSEEQSYFTRIKELTLMPKLYELEENRTFIDELSRQLNTLRQKLEKLNHPLEQRILEECLLNEERSLIWETVFNRLKEIIMKINEIEVSIVNDVVECDYYDHQKYETIMTS
ncbi:MAG: AAA family ATPase, partial [Turicibacter sp.]|nr:AAA family ATPase [Turicibacter sp.]